jgi:hypothetical protein
MESEKKRENNLALFFLRKEMHKNQTIEGYYLLYFEIKYYSS